MNKQSQKSGNNSTNVQAENIIVNQGCTYSEVKEIVLDVFKSNFYKLGKEAQETAKKRAEEITEDFLQKLQKENPNGFLQSKNPDFQYSLFTVQKEYARNGDKKIGDLLVDLLVDRSKQEQRNFLQIVLNESLDVVPKLTNDHISALTVIFLLRHTENYIVYDHKSLGEYLDNYLKPFIDNLSKKESFYRYLEYCKCGSQNINYRSLTHFLQINFQGLFLKGFEIEEITKRQISIGEDSKFFIPCFNNSQKLQVNTLSKHCLEKQMKDANLLTKDQQEILDLFELNKMADIEIEEKCIEIRPYMRQLFDVYSSVHLINVFELTSVGIAIGHANLKRFVEKFTDLSLWIN